jgi:hypothetical protein
LARRKKPAACPSRKVAPPKEYSSIPPASGNEKLRKPPRSRALPSPCHEVVAAGLLLRASPVKNCGRASG